jgi:hypothetical protein
MRLRRGVAALAVLTGWAAAAGAADLTKIDRTIAREPAYKTRNPKYCLVVFGPEAKQRVWLVLDGDTLYVDKSGDGDFTHGTERLVARSSPGADMAGYPFAEIRQFPTINCIAEAAGKKYTGFSVTHTPIKRTFVPTNAENRELQASFEKDATFTRAGVTVMINGHVRVQAVCEWGDRPEDAPVCHIDGPLTMAPLNRQELRRGDGAPELQFCLGFRGLGKRPEDAFAIMDYTDVPKKLQPIAQFTFENRDPDKPPIVLTVKLDRC